MQTTNDMNINDLAQQIKEWREAKGFETTWDNTPAKLMLIVSELSEALEDYRDDNKVHFGEEMADVLIRTLDLCASLGYDTEKEIMTKFEFNKTRPMYHGRKNKL